MVKNYQLSIVIPTFNRAEALDHSLKVHIPILRDHGIGLYIFDNNSTDNTEKVVGKWMNEYEHLSYYKNERNIGARANIERALRHPDSDYIWMIGDTYQLPTDCLAHILKLFENCSYDAVVFNLANKLTLPSSDYKDHNFLLRDLGALTSCLSCTIFSKEMLNMANFSKHQATEFPHTRILFEGVSQKNFVVHWMQQFSVSVFEEMDFVKSNWFHSDQIWEIACEDWVKFIMSLPTPYTIENKKVCIKDFGKISGHFTLSGFFLLRMNGLLNFKIANQNRDALNLSADYNWWIILFISILPSSITKLLFNLRQTLRKLKPR